jgi:hypothetical protein
MRYFGIIVLLVLVIYSCNPVQQIFKDPAKMNEVAEEMIRRGYCSNDTTVINKVTDTVFVRNDEFVDTILLENGVCNFDTVLSTGTRVKFENGFLYVKEKRATKTRVITNTVNHYITDKAKEDLLNNDIQCYKDTVNTLRGSITSLKEVNETLLAKLSKYKIYIIGLIALIIGSFVWRLIRKLSNPIL